MTKDLQQRFRKWVKANQSAIRHVLGKMIESGEVSKTHVDKLDRYAVEQK